MGIITRCYPHDGGLCFITLKIHMSQTPASRNTRLFNPWGELYGRLVKSRTAIGRWGRVTPRNWSAAKLKRKTH